MGSSGQVGRQIVANIATRRDLELVTAARSDSGHVRRFELERPETVASTISNARPDHVIFAAAATNVAWCEEHEEDSRRINVDATAAGAVAAGRIGATFTFLSTDYVFDGLSGPYGELDATNPLNVYGAHKLEAEAAVLDAGKGNLVVRSC